MKIFKNQAAQGDLWWFRIASVPANAVDVLPTSGRFILAHSETGHHHVMDAREGVTLKRDPVDQFRQFLVIDSGESTLEHLRGHDTHETVAFQPGMYELRSGREFDPFEQLVRRTAD
ncbi:MAG: hypothetical protein IT548_06990 [Alphaproteobacteria bacterium]|nr:hypothetical protein [Alphaproteobacteria bacterium]